jgi:hypothetical protein
MLPVIAQEIITFPDFTAAITVADDNERCALILGRALLSE